jgi:hypothetical protein
MECQPSDSLRDPAANTASDAPERPSAPLAVVMERVLQAQPLGRRGLQGHRRDPRRRPATVTEPRKLLRRRQALALAVPGLSASSCFPDECKGYFLNLTSGKPAWFVTWRFRTRMTR